MMKIFGIETSCDETGVCLIEASGTFESDFKFEILGNALLSQAKLHEQYGGVFPNLAKREHAKNLVPLLEVALKQASILAPKSSRGLTSENPRLNLGEILSREPELLETLRVFLDQYEKPAIDAIAVTHGPGLEPALWVGVNFAKALSSVWNIPIVAVNHMEGHIMLSMMDIPGSRKSRYRDLRDPGIGGRLCAFEFPVLALLISGGHTELVLSRSWQQYELIGQTRDDAAGEAFDKVARLLGLPYPGGPEISRLAAIARKQGPTLLKLPRPMLNAPSAKGSGGPMENNFDFSFSGLKTAVRNLVDQKSKQGRTLLGDDEKAEIAREFEDAVAEVLTTKTIRAIEAYGVQTVVVGGGVSANTFIRTELAKKLEAESCKLLVPPPELATDNAIMIALAGYFHAIKKEFTESANLTAKGNLKLS